MNEQEAIAVLQQCIDVIEDDQAYSMLTKSMYEDGYRRIEAFKMAIAALNEVVSPTTQLDENGLMPCGCGGTAVRNGILFIGGYAYVTSCIECGAMAWSKKTQEEADERWNAAMGWRADK